MLLSKETFGARRLCIAVMALAVFTVGGCSHPTEVAGPSNAPPKNPAAPSTVAPLRPQAIAVVKAAFASPDTIECVYASEVVADAGLREMAPTLVKLLKGKTVPVRFAAAMALGDMKYMAAKPAIQEALGDSDQNVRMAAIYSMMRLGAGQAYIKQVYEGLSSKDPTIRANAALVLGKLRNQSALTALYWAMSDKDSDQDTRTQIAYSIALIGDEKIYPTLWTLLINSFANYRIQGIDAMGALGDAQARNAVYTMLRDDTLDVRLAAAEQLGVMHEFSGENIVLEYLKHPVSSSDPIEVERRSVRAARAVGSIGTAELAAFLPQLLQDKSPVVRLAAAKAVFQLSQ
jgi:HEAT repeat protein